MTTSVQPHREALVTTLVRTVLMALVAGAVAARWWGGLSRWPALTLVILWPSFGGHWVEFAFLEWVRPRVAGARRVQVLARVVVWFVGGVVLTVGMVWTATTLGIARPDRLSVLWVGGLAFVGLELAVHFVLRLRGAPNVSDGRG